MIDSLKENIDYLKYKQSKFLDLFTNGKISPRYNLHLGLLLKFFEYTIQQLEDISETKIGVISEEKSEKLKTRTFNTLETLSVLFLKKIENDTSVDEKILESISMDFFRMSYKPGIDTMVLIDKIDTKPSASVAPIPIEFKERRDVSMNAFFIIVNENFVNSISYWIMILHETSHILKDLDECLRSRNPRLNYECELFSDLYSTHIGGFAYLSGLIQHAKNNYKNPYTFSQSHPSIAFRVRTSLDYFKKRFESVVGEDAINKLELEWSTWVENTGYSGRYLPDEFTAETSSLIKLDRVVDELNVSNRYESIIENLKLVENGCCDKLTPIELLNYNLLIDDFNKHPINDGEIKNLIIEWSKLQYGM